MKLIDKDAVLSIIDNAMAEEMKLFETALKDGDADVSGSPVAYTRLQILRSSIDTLEVKEVDTWHSQEKENIYDAVKDWGLYKFVCIMKDGTIQKFTGNLDEDCEGHINVHINGVNDDYDNVDGIVKWIELKVQEGEEV